MPRFPASRRAAPALSPACLLAALALAWAPTALAAQQTALAVPTALTLEQAVRLATDHNPELLQQQNDIGVARSSMRAAVGGLLPSAGVSSGLGYTASGERRFGSVQFGEQPEYYSSDYSLGLSYQLSGATLLQPLVQRSQQEATERRVSGVAAGLAAQVTHQYLGVLQAREKAAQAAREVERTGEHLRLAQARLEVGLGTPLDVRRAEVQQGRAEVGLLQARNQAATAVLTLAQLIGVPLDPSVELTSRFEVFRPRWEAEALVAEALAANPQLLAARAGVEAAGTSVQAARSSYLPTLSFNVGWRGSVYQAGSIDPLVQGDLEQIARGYPSCLDQNRIRATAGLAPQRCINPGDPTVAEALRQQYEQRNRGFPFDYTRQPMSASVTISLPLFQGFTRQLEVDRARAAAADARHQVRAEELRLRREIGSVVRNLETAHQTVLLQDRVRANAAEELRLAQERFRFGAAGSVEVTDAQTNLAQAEQGYIDAVYTFHQSLAALEALVGRSLREQ